MGVAAPGRLVDRSPSLGAAELAARLVPPARFSDVRLSTYRPDPSHPSQRAALDRVTALASELGRSGGSSSKPAGFLGRLGRRAAAGGRRGLYLDGGFGVGKTHLLASLWHEAPEPKAYVTFAQLTALIGFLGMEGAIAAFGGHRLICIDEFELDDVANTLMAVTFLRAAISGGATVAATSNTLPDRLGEDRFSARDFQREIRAIADHFDVVTVDGPDYRAASRRYRIDALAEAEVDAVVDRALAAGVTVTSDALPDLLRHLRRVHPVQIGGLLDGVGAVALRGLAPVENQGDALLLVALVDALYDAEVAVAASGCRIDELFHPSYRGGGYRKKYGRAESRLEAMLAEAR